MGRESNTISKNSQDRKVLKKIYKTTGREKLLFMVERNTESILKLDFEGWEYCQEAEIMERTFQKR